MVTIELLSRLKALIMDMDGVLWRGDEPLPGLATFFAFLRCSPIRFMLVTNNATRTVAAYKARLSGFRTVVRPEEILTSAVATADYVARQAAPGTRVFVVGETGLRQALQECGLRLVEEGPVDFVVVGLDRAFTYDKMRMASALIRAGARFIGTNPDLTLPVPGGQVPGAGSILAALTAASGVTPTIIGKPEPELFRVALDRLKTAAEETAMLGDRLDTDILGGKRAGLHTILVLSGVSSMADVDKSTYKPDLIFPDIDSLRQAWVQAIHPETGAIHSTGDKT